MGTGRAQTCSPQVGPIIVPTLSSESPGDDAEQLCEFMEQGAFKALTKASWCVCVSPASGRAPRTKAMGDGFAAGQVRTRHLCRCGGEGSARGLVAVSRLVGRAEQPSCGSDLAGAGAQLQRGFPCRALGKRSHAPWALFAGAQDQPSHAAVAVLSAHGDAASAAGGGARACWQPGPRCTPFTTPRKKTHCLTALNTCARTGTFSRSS